MIHTIDILKIVEGDLRKLETPIFLKSKKARSIGNRLLAMGAFKNGMIGFDELMRSFLPTRFHVRHADERLLDLIKSNANSVFEKAGLYDPEVTVQFLGKKLIPAPEINDRESWLDTCIFVLQIVVADQYHARQFLREDSTVIDAGANMGIFSLFASSLCPKGMIYSFEPGPKPYIVLERNVSTAPNVKVFNQALGRQTGEGRLYLTPHNSGNSMMDSGISQDKCYDSAPVKIAAIDDFVNQEQLSKVDFIKIDTEGYERQILEGAKETLRAFSPVLSLSAYHRPDDKKIIPQLVRSINPKYKWKISKRAEDDLLFWI